MSLEKLLTVDDLALILDRALALLKTSTQKILPGYLPSAAFPVLSVCFGDERMLNAGCSCMLFNSTRLTSLAPLLSETWASS